ncbi:hypothetical protein WDU94_002013 [Cyamophila willieti]
MLTRVFTNAVLSVLTLTVFGNILHMYCYDLFGNDQVLDVSEDVHFDDLSLPMKARDDLKYTKLTLPFGRFYEEYFQTTTEAMYSTRKIYTRKPSAEVMLEGMKNKKIFQLASEEPNVINRLNALSYDEDEDDEAVTMVKLVWSHETPTKKIRTKGTAKKNVKLKGGSKTTKYEPIFVHENTTEAQNEEEFDGEYYEDTLETEEHVPSDDEPKQITSQEQLLYEYYTEFVGGHQTILKRKNTTEQGIRSTTKSNQYFESNLDKFHNTSLAQSKHPKKRKTIRTTTEYKVLRTEKNRYNFYKLNKTYAHLVIGKLPNTTKEKELNCLEKEIVHIFNVENMKTYLTSFIHDYKHFRNHFDDVVNLVNNVSIFDIETDDVNDPHTKTSFGRVKVTQKEDHLHKTKSTKIISHPATMFGNEFVHLHEKFDLTALNNLFNDEKKIITDYDRMKYDSITSNLKQILHCLKVNLNIEKYNFINETNVKDLVNIIWKHREKYDESEYESEYKDLYEACKTMDYYKVDSHYKDEYEYYLNQHSGIEHNGPYERNPETQNVIKEALRNMSRIRQERHEFERGILEGQLKTRCHYCGKNYSASNEERYMQHVYNHIVEELDGSDYENGMFMKDHRCLEKAMSYMTKVTFSTLPTIDVFPYYEHLDPSIEFQKVSQHNKSHNFDYYVNLKRKRDEREDLLRKNIEAKARRQERDFDLENMKKFMDRRRDFVTFSDESLPPVLKRFIKNYGNETGLTLDDIKKKEEREANLPPEENEGGEMGGGGMEHIDKILKEMPTTQKPSGEEILGKFNEKKEKQDEYRMNELKQAANELLKHKDWRARLKNMHNRDREPTTDEINVKERQMEMGYIKKVHQRRYQEKLLREKKQRELQAMWYQDNLNVDKWVFKTNKWTTIAPLQ